MELDNSVAASPAAASHHPPSQQSEGGAGKVSEQRPARAKVVIQYPSAGQMAIFIPARKWAPAAIEYSVRAAWVTVFLLVWTLMWIPALRRGGAALLLALPFLLMAVF